MSSFFFDFSLAGKSVPRLQGSPFHGEFFSADLITPLFLDSWQFVDGMM